MPPPLESVYSSVVSLHGIRMLAFIAEHNGLDLWATDVGNAYLESYTQEKSTSRQDLNLVSAKDPT